ncbi:hypothetical protein [Candidatus Uabimicrobium sp. HlEnr_7]|uniref:hypothetical protein n=1 Tax=Candidatus Uabimicrobium helgolandensis TaxID=3095367 RepID=UPI0035565846
MYTIEKHGQVTIMQINIPFDYEISLTCKEKVYTLLKNPLIIIINKHNLDGSAIFHVLVQIADMFEQEKQYLGFVLNEYNYSIFDNIYGQKLMRYFHTTQQAINAADIFLK